MLAYLNRLIRLYSALALNKSMGPGRHSLRVSARAQASARAVTTGLVTPRVSSHISKAKLRNLNLEVEAASGAESSENSEDQVAGEEFHSRGAARMLESIKRKLDFGSNMIRSTLNSNPVTSARSKPRTGTVSGLEKEPRPNLRRRSLQSSIPTKTALVKKEGTKSEEVKGIAIPKNEPLDGIITSDAREEAESLRRNLSSSEKNEDQVDMKMNGILVKVKEEQFRQDAFRPRKNQRKTSSGEGLMKTDGIVRPEPPYNGVGSKRKLSNKASLFTRLAEVEKDYQGGGVKQEIASIVKEESSENVYQAKMKLSKKVSVGTRKINKEDGLRSSAGLELSRLNPISGAQLASEGESGIVRSHGPFPNFARPYREECQQAKDLLSNLHGVLHDYERHRKSCPSVEDTKNSQPLVLPDSQSKKRARGVLYDDALDRNQSGEDLQLVLASRTGSPKDARPKAFGQPRERGTVLDSLMGTLLAQNTTDKNSRKAFAALKSAFPTWEQVLKADPKDVEEAIRSGGLAEIKAARMRNILDTVSQERGEISLEYLRSMSNEDIKSELSRFKGVGPKTVACVLMFHLQRSEFPVDTHVFRISKMLGWIPESADREKAYLHLNKRIPDSLKFDLHCLFVTHGKRCDKCAKRNRQQPMDGPCPLVNWKSKWSKLSPAAATIQNIADDKLRLEYS